MRLVHLQVPLENEQSAGAGGGGMSFQQMGTRVLCPQETMVKKGARSEKHQLKGESYNVS